MTGASIAQAASAPPSRRQLMVWLYPLSCHSAACTPQGDCARADANACLAHMRAHTDAHAHAQKHMLTHLQRAGGRGAGRLDAACNTPVPTNSCMSARGLLWVHATDEVALAAQQDLQAHAGALRVMHGVAVLPCHAGRGPQCRWYGEALQARGGVGWRRGRWPLPDAPRVAAGLCVACRLHVHRRRWALLGRRLGRGLGRRRADGVGVQRSLFLLNRGRREGEGGSLRRSASSGRSKSRRRNRHHPHGYAVGGYAAALVAWPRARFAETLPLESPGMPRGCAAHPFMWRRRSCGTPPPLPPPL
jgi:hypothetical protein